MDAKSFSGATQVVSASEAKRVLIVDDEPQMRAMLRALLEPEQFRITEAANGAELLDLLTRESFDLITLDLSMPGTSGVELARELCRVTDIPVIVISGRRDEYDLVVTLELGADDYIAKPFNTREFVARVRAILRRASANGRRHPLPRPPSQSEISFHDYVLNIQTRRLRNKDGQTANLTVAECKLLEVLVKNAGRACTRDEIAERVKGRSWSPFDRSLDTLVGRLRRKIEPDPDQPTLLTSVRGVGYMMTV
jgi:two-component system, OmpR family, response regulator